MEYDTFKNDLTRQKKLHLEFQNIIQVIFGLTFLYQDMTHVDGPRNLIQCTIRPQSDKYNLTLHDDYKFIDIDPQNEDELKVLCDIMIQDIDDDFILGFLQRPLLDREFEMIFDKRNMTDIGEPLVFPSIDPYSLFYKVWKIKYDDVNN